MNETPKTKSGGQLRRAFFIWLIFFVAVATMVAVADFFQFKDQQSLTQADRFKAAAANFFQLKDGIENFPSLLSQIVVTAIISTILYALLLFIRWSVCSWHNLRRVLVGTAILTTLVAIFYTEEDWRGKRAWENCKRELEAKGAVLDWDKYIPPPVPDDQNFFTASTNIYLRFVKQQDETRADAAAHLQWLRLINYFTNESYSFPILDFAKSNQPVVAEISIATAKNDSTINLDDPAARDKIQNLVRTTIGQSINGAQGFLFSEMPLDHLSPAKIELQSSGPVSIGDLENFIPSDLVINIGKLAIKATVDPKIFQVKFVSGRITAAADYLKWSDQFAPAFDEIREALKRPYAIIPGDYSVPYLMPIPNFVTMRALAQTLAQRAQCDFLLGKPDDALRELTLIHDMCRILEKPPIGKPETLVEAMINVAITGLYTATVAEGFRLHAWPEPQLAGIQEQLKEINLPPIVLDAFKSGLAGSVHTIETTPANKIADLYGMVNVVRAGSAQKKIGFWTRFANPTYLFFRFSPRGWIYQNMANVTGLQSELWDGLDLEHDIIAPPAIDKAGHNAVKSLDHISPFNVWTRIATPNFIKVWQTTAHTQTQVNEAQIACALERYRLAHGEYPQTLDALAPQFIAQIPHDIIGGQPLHYRRTDDGKFLLYSIGWNEKDDGGVDSSDTKNASSQLAVGDWVWKN